MGNKLFEQIIGIFNNESNFKYLVDNFKKDRVIPFIGAGFSRPQFPDWTGLIEKESVSYGVKDEIKTQLDLGNMEKAASITYYKVDFTKNLFCMEMMVKVL